MATLDTLSREVRSKRGAVFKEVVTFFGPRSVGRGRGSPVVPIEFLKLLIDAKLPCQVMQEVQIKGMFVLCVIFLRKEDAKAGSCPLAVRSV